MAVTLAKNMKWFFGATAVTCQVDASLSGSTNMFETTCKDSGADSEFQPGAKSWTISGTALFDPAATLGFATATNGIFEKWDDQASVSVVFQTGTTGEKKWSGTAYVTSWELTSNGLDAAVEYSFQMQGTGALTMATI